MAKNITYFDREHTGGINLAAMEDTQLKENLVQDIAAGGEEAPTATAVKEAVDVKMDKADIINDLTTGGTDKALSAEQGKVLEGKKVDKLTDATDLVYVHGADGTEQGKALSEFVVDTDIVDDVTTGGVDKVLAEQGKVLEGKKVDKLTAAQDLVYVHEAAGTETGKALSEFVVDADIVNDRVTGGVDKVLAAEVGKDIPASFELNFTVANYPLTAATIDKSKFTDHVMSISTLYVHPDEIPAEIKGKLKKGDIVSTVVASPILSCKAIFSYIAAADESSTNITSDVVNTSLPAAGNWEGWYRFQVIVSEQDKLIIKGKTNTYCTFLFDGDETLETLPDANGPMPTGGFSYSVVFIKPSDIKANRLTTGIPSPYVKQVDGSTIKPGDILIIDTPNSAEATKKIRSMQCLITHTAAASNKMLDNKVMNTKLPAAGNWGGWFVGRILSSGWDREALLSKTDSTKMQNYWVTLPTDGETFASMPDIHNVGYGKGMSGSNFFVHPDDIASISGSLKRGDIVTFTGNVSSTGETFETVTAIYTGVKATGTELLGEADLNVTPPSPGNYKGWHIFYTLSTVYDRRIVQKKVNYWTITVKSTDQQFKDTWLGSKTNAIQDKASPCINFMLTKDMMAQIPDAKVGDLIYVYGTTADTGLPYDIHFYGVLHSRSAVSSPTYWYAMQDNTGDITGCGSMRLTSSNLMTDIVKRKPNFWTMAPTPGNSNIPAGLKSLSTIAFAPGADTAAFADALKKGDLIEVRNVSDVMYTLMFIRYATNADNINNKNMIVGQVAEPADMTGYLWCRIISSRYDADGTIVYRTNKYQPNQFEIGKSYRINITVSEATDQLNLYGLGIDSPTFEEYNCVIRRGFKIGDMVNLLLENTTKSVILLVTLGFTQADNSIHVLCIANGENQITTDLG